MKASLSGGRTRRSSHHAARNVSRSTRNRFLLPRRLVGLNLDAELQEETPHAFQACRTRQADRVGVLVHGNTHRSRLVAEVTSQRPRWLRPRMFLPPHLPRRLRFFSFVSYFSFVFIRFKTCVCGENVESMPEVETRLERRNERSIDRACRRPRMPAVVTARTGIQPAPENLRHSVSHQSAREEDSP